jgi:polyferredoxin
VSWLIGAALIARTFARGLVGTSLGLHAGLPRRERMMLGLGMSSTGVVTMLIGLAFAFRFPGTVGSAVLCCAACMTAFGEVLGPTGLRRALRASSIPPPPPAAEAVS